MEKLYNDELLPEDFEEIAKAYAQRLKKRGFVFVRLDEEEFNLLVEEILVILSKMRACLKRLEKQLESKKLLEEINSCESQVCEQFGNKKPHNLSCVANENEAFLSLMSLENMFVLKTLSLSVKSGELELCNSMIASIAGVIATSFDTQGFVVN